jgi:hypothetical protein
LLQNFANFFEIFDPLCFPRYALSNCFTLFISGGRKVCRVSNHNLVSVCSFLINLTENFSVYMAINLLLLLNAFIFLKLHVCLITCCYTVNCDWWPYSIVGIGNNQHEVQIKKLIATSPYASCHLHVATVGEFVMYNSVSCSDRIVLILEYSSLNLALQNFSFQW